MRSPSGTAGSPSSRRATKTVVRQSYGKAPRRTYLFGISNGGYLTRWQLENKPWLYDGGIDWEGTLFRAAGPNLLTYLPTALREYPKYRAGDKAAHRRMLAAGFAPGSEFTWEYHYGVYWDLTQRLYREEFDPSYDGALDAGIPFCPSGTPNCDADYDYAKRPAAHSAMRKVQLTGNLRRPMLTLHGTLDALLPIATDSDVYRQMIKRRDHGNLHRYYRIAGGTHVDGLNGTYGDRVRPILPCARNAFTQMTSWVEHRQHAPAEPDDPATRGWLGHGEHMRAAVGQTDRTRPRGRSAAMVSFRVTSITLRTGRVRRADGGSGRRRPTMGAQGASLPSSR